MLNENLITEEEVEIKSNKEKVQEFWLKAKKNNYILKLIMVLAFGGSWWFTVCLVLTMAITTTDAVISIIIATVIQASGIIFFIYKKLWIAYTLFAISILSTVSYQYNLNNAIINEALQGAKQEQQQITNVRKDIVSRIDEDKARFDKATEREMDNLESSKQALIIQISSLEGNKNNISNTIGAWNVNNAKEKIDIQIQDITKQVQQIDSRMSELNNTYMSNVNNASSQAMGLESISLEKGEELEIALQTKGYLGISQKIASYIGVDFSTVILLIQMLIGIAFEVTAVKLHLLIMKIENNGEELNLNDGVTRAQ